MNERAEIVVERVESGQFLVSKRYGVRQKVGAVFYSREELTELRDRIVSVVGAPPATCAACKGKGQVVCLGGGFTARCGACEGAGVV